MNKDFIINLLTAFLFIDKQNDDYWFLINNKIKIRIERFDNKVNYQELDENNSLIKGYWLLEDKTLYGPYTDHMN